MQVAGLVTAEFFEQGDMEREDLNLEPIVRTLLLHPSLLPEHNTIRDLCRQ